MVKTRRFSDQTVVTRNGTLVRGKSVRRCSRDQFISLGGKVPNGNPIFGEVRLNGLLLPVSRRRNAKRWKIAGIGVSYYPTMVT